MDPPAKGSFTSGTCQYLDWDLSRARFGLTTLVPTTPENTKIAARKHKTETNPAQQPSLPTNEEHFSIGKAHTNT